MQYTSEVTIRTPRDRVVELLDNADNLKQWQPTLKSAEHLSGEPDQTGARTRMVYGQGGRPLELIETITRRNFPDEFAATYEGPGVYNIVANRFIAVDGQTMRWVAEHEFRFSGMMKLMAIFMRGAFPKQTQDFMQEFKNFAEGA